MWQRSTAVSPELIGWAVGLAISAVLGLILALAATLSNAATSVESPVYASATNLQAHINSFGTHTRENMIYLVREGYDGTLTVADLYKQPLSNFEAQERCQTLLDDLQGAPASDRVANVWVLSGLEGTEEQHSVCKGRRE
jgi:hypothetical protein